MNAKLWMTLVMLSGLASVFAQTCKEPNWYNATDAAGGHLLHGTASGTTQNEASEKAWSMALMQLGLSNVTELRSTLEVYKSVTNGQPANVQVNQSNVSSGETKLQAGKDLLLIRESAGIDCPFNVNVQFVLLCRPDQGVQCILEDQSNWGAALRSVVIPGLGQGYKHHPIRGTLFFSGVAATTVSAFVFNSMSNTNYDNAVRARTLNAKKASLDLSNQQANISLGMVVGAIALYLWNVADAYMVDGTPIVK